MSETEISAERDERTGRFLTGGKPGPGRPVGSRNKLAENFVADLKEIWEEHGISALQTVARDDPGTLIKVVAGLMPRDLNLNIGISAETFVATFRSAQQLLGNPEPTPRRLLPKQKPVDHGG